MKIWVKAATVPGATFQKALNDASRKLGKYTDEQVKYVRDCLNEVTADISEAALSDFDEVSPNTFEIKRDYLVGAIEDDLLTEEEFNEIYECLETIQTGEASAFS